MLHIVKLAAAAEIRLLSRNACSWRSVGDALFEVVLAIDQVRMAYVAVKEAGVAVRLRVSRIAA